MFSVHHNHNEKLTCLISPLDWGLGHTTRVFPVIRQATERGYNIIIACNPTQKKVFKEEFPNVMYEEINGYNMHYGKSGGFTMLQILLQIPKILIKINFERTWVAEYIKQNHVDIIISDNRYGFRSKNIHSIFITHQLAPKSGFGKFADRFMQFFLYGYVNKFKECRIPDNETVNMLAGALSHPPKMPKIPVKFLGPLSRLENIPAEWHSEPVPEKFILIILSGPEPQRSILENKILKDVQNSPLPLIIVQGKPGQESPAHPNENLKFFSHLKAPELVYLIEKAALIVTRSGYSSLMDLAVMGKDSIMIPTPGQAEQQYLAEFHKETYGREYINQSDFSFNKVVEIIRLNNA